MVSAPYVIAHNQGTGGGAISRVPGPAWAMWLSLACCLLELVSKCVQVSQLRSEFAKHWSSVIKATSPEMSTYSQASACSTLVVRQRLQRKMSLTHCDRRVSRCERHVGALVKLPKIKA